MSGKENGELRAADASGLWFRAAGEGDAAGATMARDASAAPDGPLAPLEGAVGQPHPSGQDAVDLSGLILSLPAAGTDAASPVLDPVLFDITVTDVVADFDVQHGLVDMSAVLESLSGPAPSGTMETPSADPAGSDAGVPVGMAALSGIDTAISIIYDESWVPPHPVA
jgi:hypothetical protein